MLFISASFHLMWGRLRTKIETYAVCTQTSMPEIGCTKERVHILLLQKRKINICILSP